ncbi:bifunctional diguanylate cyclase/phosphodiesterase [Nitrosospira sp. Nsp13]|uniref:putative bifunctional diguanylate cyclase/phosphodiesterase n=1 Tax=Nitrosospira sp. Nsp13 TaxID=1855332 RepID=UPI00088C1C3E|nr:EAL domain-containing protein [Nitrosospira sp. Nsp13]SCX78858.1 diguanylate cyclase/phosphodiesterase [Nitrosospira sp. Nsp13]
MHGTYDYWLVALSLAMAMLASYTALDLSGHISVLTRPRIRHAWLAGGAAAMGIGIWSMHFIGMLAFSLPISLGYDLATTSYSLVIAILLSYFVLYIVTQKKLTPLRLITGGTLMGFGISSMHYTGMAAMQMQPGIHHDPTLFVTSIVIAIAAANAALWIALSDTEPTRLIAKRIGAAFLMGIAITGMHYTGMAAAHFPLDSVSSAANGINSQWLTTTIILLSFAFLIGTLMVLRFDARTSFLVGSVSQLNSQIIRLATFDTLTNLPNRWTLMERMEQAIHASRHHQKMFAILFMDLDGFKIINDSLGHSAGDEILKAFAQRLLHCVRGGDMVVRLGGDEFVVLLENLASPADAANMAESVLSRMRQGLWADNQPLQVMPSIGITLFPQDGDTAEALLKNADAAMYEAKRGGRSTYRFFEANMNEAATRTLQIQHALHEALVTDYFSLHFQPKFRGDNGELTGAEVLLRLRHPELGPLLPMEFIPIAERSGQIVQIGYWVVRETCRQIRRWKESGLPVIKVAINLSPRQLEQSDLVARMLDIVRSEQVPCEQIMFEITETVAMQDAPKTTNMIREFQENNFEIAIDDFGTGYSSLAYLQRFRAKQLKIDRFFTNGLDEYDHEGSAIVSAIIKLAHSLEMDVVAEGVETASQLEKLKGMMCDEMQGFLLGKPLAAEEFSALLHGHKGGSLLMFQRHRASA